MEPSSVSVDRASLNSLLTCTLCNGYLLDPHTIAECCHSFCRDCLVKYFIVCDTQGREKFRRTDCPFCHTSLAPNPFNFIKQDTVLNTIVLLVHNETFKRYHMEEEAFYQERGIEKPNIENCFKLSIDLPSNVSKEYVNRRKGPTVHQLARGKYYQDEVVFKLQKDEDFHFPLFDTELLPQCAHSVLEDCTLFSRPFVKTTSRVTVGCLCRLISNELVTVRENIRQKRDEMFVETNNQDGVIQTKDESAKDNIVSITDRVSISSSEDFSRVEKDISSEELYEIELLYQGELLNEANSLDFVFSQHKLTTTPVFVYRMRKEPQISL